MNKNLSNPVNLMNLGNPVNPENLSGGEQGCESTYREIERELMTLLRFISLGPDGFQVGFGLPD